MKIAEISNNSKAWNQFKHTVCPDNTDSRSVALMHQWRTWCWEVWGPSGELAKVINWRNIDTFKDPAWCWDTDYNNLTLYFKSDEQLSAFLLQWQEH
jgi:hypothetical protein